MADYGEVDWTADQRIIASQWKPLTPHPPFILYIVRLKAEVADSEGLLSHWALPFPLPKEGDPFPAPGMVFTFGQGFDWDSPRWGQPPVPGSAGAVGEGSSAAGTETATLACGLMLVGEADGIVQQGVGNGKALSTAAQRCGAAAANGSGNVLQLAAGLGPVVGADVDVT